MRDVRQLPNINEEIKRSLHPGTAVYYRVDILKALIGDHMMRSPDENAQFCVVSDIDVEPMSSEKIFHQRTLDFLSSSGYVFNRVSYTGHFENSFFIFNKENTLLQNIHYKTIIERTAWQLTNNRKYPIGTCFYDKHTLDSQFVFQLYDNFREEMQEPDDELLDPRIVVKCPPSQFNGGYFHASDFQNESFRFFNDSNVPYTRYGRNYKCSREQPIEALINWQAEPLLPLV